MNTSRQGHIGALVIAVLFILIGLLALYDTTTYADRDSRVFPQTIAIILIITASIALIRQFLTAEGDYGFGRGIWWRRGLFVITMFATCLLIPKIGFLAAGTIAFGGGLIAAMHDRWSLRTILLYWGSGAVLMVSFFAIFKYLLYVPLP